jgi:hypothetical protein
MADWTYPIEKSRKSDAGDSLARGKLVESASETVSSRTTAYKAQILGRRKRAHGIRNWPWGL